MIFIVVLRCVVLLQFDAVFLTITSLRGKTLRPMKYCSGCRNADFTGTSQWHFVSLTMPSTHRKVKINPFVFFIKCHPFYINRCKIGKYFFLFWIFHMIHWNNCFCFHMYKTPYLGLSLGLTATALGQLSQCKWDLHSSSLIKHKRVQPNNLVWVILMGSD